MDGHFVSNLSFVSSCESDKADNFSSRITLNVHLMVEKPEKFITEFIYAGADSITVHIEACTDIIKLPTNKKFWSESRSDIKPDTPEKMLMISF